MTEAAQLPLMKAVPVRFSAPEREVFRYREEPPIVDWAEEYIHVPFGKGGPYRREFAPMMAVKGGPFEAALYPYLRRMYLAMNPQSSKTLCGQIITAHRMFHRPSRSLNIMDALDASGKMSTHYVQPLFRGSPKLRYLLPEDRDAKSKKSITFRNGHIYDLTWWGRAQTFPYELVVGDEIKDWGTGGEEIAYKRLVQYPHTGLAVMVSSIKDELGNWRNLRNCMQLRMLFVTCLHCGVQQVPVWGAEDTEDQDTPGIKFNKEIDEPGRIEAETLARYRCANPECDGPLWDEDDFNRVMVNAIDDGEWHPVTKAALGYFENEEGKIELDQDRWNDPFPEIDPDPHPRPVTIGFLQPMACTSPEVNMSTMVAQFLTATRTQDPVEKKRLLNIFMLEQRNRPWQEKAKPIFEPEKLLEGLKDNRPAELVPAEALCLVLGADVQGDGIWYELRAVLDPIDLTSALVAYGFLMRGVYFAEKDENAPWAAALAPDFMALARILDKPFYDPHGREVIKLLNGFDSGYRTAEVYEFVRRRGIGNVATKGEDFMATPLRYKKIDTYPGKTVLIPGGVQLVHINTWHFKSDLQTRLAQPLDAPGAWRLHADTKPDYGRHYTAEYPDQEKKKWVQRGAQPNHLFDCGVGCRAMMEILRGEGSLANLAQAMKPKAQEMAKAETKSGGNPLAGRRLNPKARR